MTSKDQDKSEPFFRTEDVEIKLVAMGYEFEPPHYAGTKSIRELYGWQPGYTCSTMRCCSAAATAGRRWRRRGRC